MGFFGSLVKVVTAPAKVIVHTAEHAAATVAHTVEHVATTAAHTVTHAATTAAHTVGHAATSAVHHATQAISHTAHSVISTVHHAVHTVEHAASTAAHTIGHAATSTVHHVTHTVEHAAHSVINAGHHVVDLAAHEASSVAKTLGHAAVEVGTTLGHDAAHVFTTVTHGASTLGSEAVKTAGGVAHAISHGVTAIGEGVAHGVEHAASTAGKLAGDAVQTAGHVAGDLVHGNLGKAGADLAAGAGKTASDLAHGASDVAHDAGQAAAGVGHAVVEAHAAVGSGVLEMAGTAAGVVGSVAKDYEHAMGVLVKDAVDSVGQIAKSEVAVLYGTAGIAASTVGTPVGDFYANVAKHYGDAAIGTLDHLNTAIDDAVVKATAAGGHIANSIGHGADTIGHDSSKVVGDVSKGDFDAAGHDLAQLGKTGFEAVKDYAGAEMEGAKALASIGSAVGTVLGGLNEAMARAGGGFVSAVGETIGGNVGHAIGDAGNALGTTTAVTANLVQGNVGAAAVEGAKVLGGLAGQWVGEQVKDVASSLGDKAGGGLIGEGLKALGDAGADAIKDGAKDLAGSAAGKGVDFVKGHEPAPAAAAHDDAAAPAAKAGHDESLLEKGQHAIDDAAHHAIDKAGDLIDKATHDPQWALNQIADAVKDHFGKGATDALGKVTGVHDAAHANGDASAAHAAEAAPIGTTHAALSTASASEASAHGFWDLAGHGDGHGLDFATAAQALTQGNAASAVASAHIPLLETHSLVPSFGGSDSVESLFGNHSSWSEATSQSMPAGFTEAGGLGGHELQATLQNALHGISFSEPQLLSLGLDGAHAGQTHGAALESMAQVTQQHMPDFDHAMPAHFELPSMLDGHFAHQLV